MKKNIIFFLPSGKGFYYTLSMKQYFFIKRVSKHNKAKKRALPACLQFRG